MKSILAFKNRSLAKKETVYSELISLEKLKSLNFLNDAATTTKAKLPVAIQAIQEDGTGGTIALVLEGSLDGANFESGTELIAALANDAAYDRATLVVDFYPFYRLAATEDDTNACTGLYVWLAFG